MNSYLNSVLDSIKERKKEILFSLNYSSLFFFIVHGYFFLHRYANEDYHHEFYNVGKVVTSGRFVGIFSDIMNPWLQGIIAALLMAFVSYMIIDLLRLRKTVSKLAVMALLVSFPALSHGFAYLYMTEVYTIAIFCATAAVYVTETFRYGFLLGAVFLCISLGAYQSYLGFAVVLSILVVVTRWYGANTLKNINPASAMLRGGRHGGLQNDGGETLECGEKVAVGTEHSMPRKQSIEKQVETNHPHSNQQKFIKKEQLSSLFVLLLRLLFMGILGLALYFAVVKLLYPLIGIELDDYKGINEMGALSVSQIPQLFVRTYVGYAKYLLGRRFFSASIAKVFAHLLMGFSIAGVILKRAIEKRFREHSILVLFLIALLPIGFNIVDFMVPKWHAITINTYQFVLLYVWFVQLAEVFVVGQTPDFEPFTEPIAKRRGFVLSFVLSVVLVFVILWDQLIASHTYYLKVEDYYENSVAFYNRLYARMEATEGYYADIPIALFANRTADYVQGGVSTPGIIESPGLLNKYIGITRYDTEFYNKKSIEMMENILGISIVMATEEQYESIKHSLAYQDMAVYPAEGSIAFINGVMVVNFVDPTLVESNITDSDSLNK